MYITLEGLSQEYPNGTFTTISGPRRVNEVLTKRQKEYVLMVE